MYNKQTNVYKKWKNNERYTNNVITEVCFISLLLRKRSDIWKYFHDFDRTQTLSNDRAAFIKFIYSFSVRRAKAKPHV